MWVKFPWKEELECETHKPLTIKFIIIKSKHKIADVAIY